MAESASMVQDSGADIVDINLGCPVKKVVRQGGGSNLLRDLPLLQRIFRAVRKSVAIPLTVKIRSGWDKKSVNALDVLRVAEDCGLEALTIHGRTREDLFSGAADWAIIAKVKAHAQIPIIGNGDVFHPEDAARMFRETGVDGVMMGRGVLSNPWLIRQCWDYLSGEPVTRVSLARRAAFMTDFLQKVNLQSPPQVALGKLKKIGGYLSKGFPGSTHLRARIHGSHTTTEFFDVLQEYFSRT
jgi:nifR3 family TIM-barrel protein